jgi:hypothetical protein
MAEKKKKGGALRHVPKGTKAEIEKRVLFIVQLMEMGITTYTEITKYCKAEKTESKPWQITSSATISDYIKMAAEIIRTDIVPDLKHLQMLQMRRLNRHYRRAVGTEARTVKIEETGTVQKLFVNDESRALAVLQQMNRINGLEVTRHEMTGKGGGPIQFTDLTDEALKEKVDEYERRHGNKKPK